MDRTVEVVGEKTRLAGWEYSRGWQNSQENRVGVSGRLDRVVRVAGEESPGRLDRTVVVVG